MWMPRMIAALALPQRAQSDVSTPAVIVVSTVIVANNLFVERGLCVWLATSIQQVKLNRFSCSGLFCSREGCV